MEWPLDHGDQLFPVFGNQRGITGPVNVALHHMHKFTHLVELFPVGIIEPTGNHRGAIGQNHVLQHVVEHHPGQFKFPDMDHSQSCVGTVPYPLIAIFENTGIHFAIFRNISWKDKPAIVMQILNDFVFRCDFI